MKAKGLLVPLTALCMFLLGCSLSSTDPAPIENTNINPNMAGAHNEVTNVTNGRSAWYAIGGLVLLGILGTVSNGVLTWHLRYQKEKPRYESQKQDHQKHRPDSSTFTEPGTRPSRSTDRL